ncbi:hypothetical protein HPP92_019738 [Vanilla planifolia]|uniref:Uncharacterized protein n=1 Tax=Vanilla planifolia TaxID=51239 RepID=A0A835Q4M1_VANPL|nr:hypothetical protein HPP92_019738 [Vanilla planifolia]
MALWISFFLLTLLYFPQGTKSCFSSIFSFGDSIADTGNLLYSLHGRHHVNRLPYGSTFFHHPTGRFSDGRLIVDFIAEAMGMPFLRPFLPGPGEGGFRRGVNFAVGGATALETGYFRKMGPVTWTNLSLEVQLDWFKGLLPSLCSTDSECKDLLSSSLFLAGEIGGNDYNYQFELAVPFHEIKSSIPTVIKAISDMINVLVDLGARYLVVPGNFPIGCNAAFLTRFQSSKEGDYNPETGCINWLNEFAEYHNAILKQELQRLRLLHPHATIIYADYYNALMSQIKGETGLSRVPLAACCGGGGPYNYNYNVECGDWNSTVCDDPSSYIYWDGVHLTEAAYRVIAKGIIEGPFSFPPLKEICKDMETLYIGSSWDSHQQNKQFK